MRPREYIVPLQALLAVTFCFGLVWMLYAMAFFDSTPPTALEVRAAVTQDLEMNDLKTAAVLTVNALFGMGPTQIWLPTFTPTLTFTSTSTIEQPSSLPVFATLPATATQFSIVPTATEREHNLSPGSTLVPSLTMTPSHVPTLTSIPATPTDPDVTPTPVDTIEPPTATPEPPTPTEPAADTPTEPPATTIPIVAVPAQQAK